MQSALLVFLAFVAASVTLAAIAVARLEDPAARWKTLVLPLPFCFLFGQPSPCDQYRFLIGPFGGHLGEGVPVALHIVAVGLAVLAGWGIWRWMRPGPARLVVIAVAAAFIYRLLRPDPDGQEGPVGAVGWWLTVVAASVGARAIAGALAPATRRRLPVLMALAMLISFSIMLAVETMGVAAGLWEWRAPGTESSNMDTVLGAGGTCPDFVPYDRAGFLPFPVANAFVGWSILITFAPTTLIFLTTEGRRPTTSQVLSSLALIFGPTLLVVGSMLVVRALTGSGDFGMEKFPTIPRIVLEPETRALLGDLFPKLHLLAILLSAGGLVHMSRYWLIQGTDGSLLLGRIGAPSIRLLLGSLSLVVACCALVLATLGRLPLIAACLPLMGVLGLLAAAERRAVRLGDGLVPPPGAAEG